jgi:hypothetical protein
LKGEIDSNHLCVSVFTPNQHYIRHLKQVVETLGPLRAYSTRSLERTIGRYKNYITAKKNMGINVGKVLERLAIRDYLTLDDEQDVETDEDDNQKIRNFKWAQWWDRGDDGAQLWGPLFTNINYRQLQQDSLVFAMVPKRTLTSALRKFYQRRFPSRSPTNLVVSVDFLSVAARAWHDNNDLNSALYFSRLKLSSKSNEAVLFMEKLSSKWFVGSVLFYFKNTFSKKERYLAFVKVADEQLVLQYTKTIPVVSIGADTLYFGRHNKLIPPSPTSKYMVIEVGEIISVVGLVQCPEVDGRYKAISPKLMYNIDWSQNIGTLEKTVFQF